jgi:hypothetical protein
MVNAARAARDAAAALDMPRHIVLEARERCELVERRLQRDLRQKKMDAVEAAAARVVLRSASASGAAQGGLKVTT